MKIRDIAYRGNRKEVLYLLALTVYLFTLLLTLTVLKGNSAFMQVIKYVQYGCYIIALIKILLDSFDKKSFWIICIVTVLIFIVTIQMDSRTYLYYFLMIIAARDVNIREIIKWACIAQGIVLTVFVIASQIGWVENYFFLQHGRNRYSLGFLYTTYAPALFFFIMMGYIYLRKERMKIYEFAAMEVINIWLFVMTDSRMIFYLSTIMLAYVFFMRYFWQNRVGRIRKNRWLILAPAAVCAGSICLHVLYNSESTFWVELNSFFTDRLELGRAALDQYGITLFGQKITWVSNVKFSDVGTYNFVDCPYLKVLLDGGVVLLVLVIAAYTYMMYMAVKSKDYYLQTILLFIVLLCITETRLVNLAFNPFLLLIATAWRTEPMEKLDIHEKSIVHRFRIKTTQIRLKSRC